jgi:uncharacterized membrane protein
MYVPPSIQGNGPEPSERERSFNTKLNIENIDKKNLSLAREGDGSPSACTKTGDVESEGVEAVFFVPWGETRCYYGRAMSQYPPILLLSIVYSTAIFLIYSDHVSKHWHAVSFIVVLLQCILVPEIYKSYKAVWVLGTIPLILTVACVYIMASPD